MSPLTFVYYSHTFAVEPFYYGIVVNIFLIVIIVYHVATVSDCIDSQVAAVVVHVVVVPFVFSFVNLFVYVVIGAIICAISIDLVRTN